MMKIPVDLCNLTLSDVEGRSDDLKILKHYEAIANTPNIQRENLPGELQSLIRRDLEEFVLTGRSSATVRAMVCAVLNVCTVKLDKANRKQRASFVLSATGLTAQPREIKTDECLRVVAELSPWVDDPKMSWEIVANEMLSDEDKAEGLDGVRRLKDAQRRKSALKTNG